MASLDPCWESVFTSAGKTWGAEASFLVVSKPDVLLFSFRATTWTVSVFARKSVTYWRICCCNWPKVTASLSSVASCNPVSLAPPKSIPESVNLIFVPVLASEICRLAEEITIPSDPPMRSSLLCKDDLPIVREEEVNLALLASVPTMIELPLIDA